MTRCFTTLRRVNLQVITARLCVGCSASVRTVLTNCCMRGSGHCTREAAPCSAAGSGRRRAATPDTHHAGRGALAPFSSRLLIARRASAPPARLRSATARGQLLSVGDTHAHTGLRWDSAPPPPLSACACGCGRPRPSSMRWCVDSTRLHGAQRRSSYQRHSRRTAATVVSGSCPRCGTASNPRALRIRMTTTPQLALASRRWCGPHRRLASLA
jgi:hypothetical protein